MKETIKMPNDVVRIITPLYQQRDCEVEHCAIMVIDNYCQVKSVHFVGQGSETECVIPLKVICKKAILDLASGVILIHNHPSGVCKPSPSDIKQTEKLSDVSVLSKHHDIGFQVNCKTGLGVITIKSALAKEAAE